MAQHGRRPTWEIGVSLAGHALLLLGLVAAEALVGPDDPPFKPEDVTWISATPPLKAPGLPQKAMRTPDPPKGETPPDNSPPPPEPPKASEMQLPKEDAPKPPGAEKPPPQKDDEAARAKKRADLLRDMNAQVGPEDRPATDPNGVEGDFTIVGGPGGVFDPVLSEYVDKCRAAILPNWTPLPSTVTSHPNYVVAVVVDIGADGTLSNPRILKSSGDAAFDRSGLLAVHKTRRFPPPPEKYARAAGNGVLINLKASDKQ